MSGIEIPFVFEEEEPMVRCIGHYLYYSKSKAKLKPTAYLPPPDSNEVSLIRKRYTSENRCKEHAKAIKKGGYTYCGLARTYVRDLLYNSEDYTFDNGDNVITELEFTPLNENNEKREDSPILSEDPGLPSHADLIYNWTPVKGQNAPNAIKRIAKKISESPQTIFFEDPNPETDDWNGLNID